ncbi:MAG: DMT family transporter, partial [Deltaproteobacteria bacterium]
MEVLAAVFWAATTIYLKKLVRERPITHFQTLFAQLFFSIPLLAAAYLIVEWNRSLTITLPVLSAFAYQTLLVAFFSYLLWFWMIHHYPVSRLAAFTFLAPLFGVIFSGLLLGEALTPMLLGGLTRVAVGIYLVNRPATAVSRG